VAQGKGYEEVAGNQEIVGSLPSGPWATFLNRYLQFLVPCMKTPRVWYRFVAGCFRKCILTVLVFDFTTSQGGKTAFNFFTAAIRQNDISNRNIAFCRNPILFIFSLLSITFVSRRYRYVFMVHVLQAFRVATLKFT
jgi:hypothetical protein